MALAFKFVAEVQRMVGSRNRPNGTGPRHGARRKDLVHAVECQSVGVGVQHGTPQLLDGHRNL
jgi:hypothetical protein